MHSLIASTMASILGKRIKNSNFDVPLKIDWSMNKHISLIVYIHFRFFDMSDSTKNERMMLNAGTVNLNTVLTHFTFKCILCGIT